MTLGFQEYENKERFEEMNYLQEKLVVFNGGKQNGQIIFLAGGAGSGKGFAINNFIDSRNAKVLDVDKLKQLFVKVAQDSSKWAPGISDTKKRERIDLADVSFKNSKDVVTLHDYINGLGLKDKVLENIMKGLGQKANQKKLPNIIFDMTGKSVGQFGKLVPILQNAGYEPKGFHVIWVLQKFSIAVKNNKKRERRVAKIQMFLTHDGAGRTMYDRMVNGYKPFRKMGLDGQFTVIFNDPKFTVFAKDANGDNIFNSPNPNSITRVFNKDTGKWERAKQTVVTDFKRVILKREGKPFAPEKGAIDMVTAEMLEAMPTLRVAMFAGNKTVMGDREKIKASGISKGNLRKQLAAIPRKR